MRSIRPFKNYNEQLGKIFLMKSKKIYEWGDRAILRHIMGQTINMQPGYYEWNLVKQREKCLFLCEDSYFEVYQPDKHGIFVDGIRQRKI